MGEIELSIKSEPKTAAEESGFEIPSWAGKPPKGLHLDVMKGEKLIQKLLIDEKSAYFFGRNPTMVDFSVDHGSCSRVHAVIVYHKHLKRMFLVDLDSTHGTFIGRIRLEGRKMEELQKNQPFHFGASTRLYVLRERISSSHTTDKSDRNDSSLTGTLLGLPEREEELENLTEYNTALNRRVVAMGVSDDDFKPSRRKKSNSVNFADEEDIINPEDVDPSVGRFRNLVYTAVIPSKRSRIESGSAEHNEANFAGAHNAPHAKHDQSHTTGASHATALPAFGSLSAKLGLSLPNPAPDVDLYPPTLPPVYTHVPVAHHPVPTGNEPPKKKYAKEAWPGKKTAQHLLI